MCVCVCINISTSNKSWSNFSEVVCAAMDINLPYGLHITSFPSLPIVVQFLIACSMQNGGGSTRSKIGEVEGLGTRLANNLV